METLEEIERFPIWTENKKGFEPKEATYILAFFVVNNKTKRSHWQIEKLHVTYDDEGMRLHCCGGDPFDDWEFKDAEFYIECED